MNNTNDDTNEIIKGLNAASLFLKSVISVVDTNGVKVVVSAEPRILEIKITEITNDGIENILTANINEAISQNQRKVMDNALSNLPKI